MKKTTSRVVSIILTLCMVMSCVFVANFAVNAQTTDVEVATSNANLQGDVQDGVILSRRPSGLRKTRETNNSLAHRTTWLRSDLILL